MFWLCLWPARLVSWTIFENEASPYCYLCEIEWWDTGIVQWLECMTQDRKMLNVCPSQAKYPHWEWAPEIILSSYRANKPRTALKGPLNRMVECLSIIWVIRKKICILTLHYRTHMVHYKQLPLHELIYYDDIKTLRASVNAMPRAAIYTALSKPQIYLSVRPWLTQLLSVLEYYLG